MDIPEPKERNMRLERLLFFSDAVVAIAITLLALSLHIDKTESGHLHFSDLLGQWKTLVAFLLSFLNIASYWKTNCDYFTYIKQMDDRLMAYIVLWLLFIILLPFSTSLIGNYFSDVTAMATYSTNILLISICQNAIWDYSSLHHLTDDDRLPAELNGRTRFLCNMDMINGVIGVGLSFISPLIAFILLFTKLPVFIIGSIWYRNQMKQGKMKPAHRKNKQGSKLPEN